MTNEQARDLIRSQPERYLQKDGSGKGYLCPLCGSGSGPKGTGITTKNGTHYTCWAGCFTSEDVIDIIGREHHLEAYPDKLRRACEIYGINLDEPYTAPIPLQATKPPADPPAKDYSGYFQECSARIAQTDYPQRRGLSQGTIERFNLGFDPAWVSPTAAAKGYRPPASPRLIIPTGPGSYIARDTRPDATGDYLKMKEGPSEIFNAGVLAGDRPVFVVEGEIDALSIIEAGGEAVGIGSITNIGKLLKLLEGHKSPAPLILALDNDPAGERGADKLAGDLEGKGLSFYRASLYGKAKDANAALLADRSALVEAIAEAEGRAAEGALGEGPSKDRPRPDAVKAYLEKGFIEDIKHFVKFKDRKTGFSNLDAHTTGLYPGLYVIGAISSLGKTTFTHQLGDQLAAAGDHVLFFSLEQNRLEMVTKSLSRLMAKKDKATAVSAIKLRSGIFPAAAAQAAEEYKEIADRVSVIECNLDTNIGFITDYTRAYMKANPGVRPVLIVDYLQIVPASDPRQSEREKVDSIVRGLKKMQSENSLVVFVVSSINRSNYLTPIDFESFKESGGIEYTADVVWGLQLAVLNDPLFNTDKKIKEKREAVKEAKMAIPRKIELVCLKNRYGVASYTCNFSYDPRFDLFEPAEDAGRDYENNNRPTRRL